MNLKEFQEQSGISVIARRHFDYDNPSAQHRSIGKEREALSLAMVWGHLLDPAELGLSPKGVQAAFEQGAGMARQGVVPTVIFCGSDQRNYDGARFTAAGVESVTGKSVPFYKNAGVGYPVYRDPRQTEEAFKRYGDYMVHHVLADEPEFSNLWTEPPALFGGRIQEAIMGQYPYERPVLFDLNFEQMTFIYFWFIEKKYRSAIPTGPGAWVPTKGGLIVFSQDFKIVREFKPDLTIVE